MSNRVVEVKNDGDTGSDSAIISGDGPFAVYINGTLPFAVSFVLARSTAFVVMACLLPALSHFELHQLYVQLQNFKPVF